MSNITKSEVNTSYPRNDDVNSSGGKKCDLLTDSSTTATSNGEQEKRNKVWSDVRLSIDDLSDKNPEFLVSTIKELQKRIEYTEKMNWLCKYLIVRFICKLSD